VRLAAAEAIVRWKPDRPFAGSSQLVGALTFLAQASGNRRIAAGAPSRESALRFSGDLSKDGFIVHPAASGIDVLRLVTESPDYEMIFLDTTIDNPPAEEIVQRIRQDCRSSALPIGLVARDGFLPRAESMARWDRAVLAFPRPHDTAGIRWEAGQLAAAAPEAIVPPDARLAEASLALDLLAELSAKPALYDLRQIEAAALKALLLGKFDAKAAAVLANIGTAESQRALVDLASRSSAPLESRRAALGAFRNNVKKAGTLLTAPEITRQYDRYNASSGESPDAQLVVAGILDVIELQAEKTAPKKPAPQRKTEKPAQAN
jgi:CheY-like chemotaxis protein